jgi:hypothetical protein
MAPRTRKATNCRNCFASRNNPRFPAFVGWSSRACDPATHDKPRRTEKNHRITDPSGHGRISQVLKRERGLAGDANAVQGMIAAVSLTGRIGPQQCGGTAAKSPKNSGLTRTEG